jgi:hypothetical protein
MSKSTELPRCGDHVVHRPTGELWLTAYVEEDMLVPAGQPVRSAPLADCEVVFRCSDEDHKRLVAVWQHAKDDVRRAQVKRLYGTGADMPGLLIPANAPRRVRKGAKPAA